MPGQIITFYSYKGGTGRTMALANVACLLAQDGGKKPVLAIDWDLEAPGLHLFFRDLLNDGDGREAVESNLNDREGLIDLLIELRERIDTRKERKQQTEDEAEGLISGIELERFLVQTSISRLYVLKAGWFDADYSRRVNAFDWVALYDLSPWLFQRFADFLADRYEYILIDSRTGRTDISNVCTMLLPEKLVVVFTPNRQSLTGVEELVRQATAYRRKSDDVRPLLVYPLASRIENSEPEALRQWRFGESDRGIQGYQTIFQETFKEAYALPRCDLSRYFDAVQVQHVPAYAYGEPLPVLTERSNDISTTHFRFKAFCDWMVSGAPPWDSADKAEQRGSEGTEVLRGTVVAVDLVGYSAISRLLEESIGTSAIGELNAQIQGFIADASRVTGSSRGQILAQTGDGAILLFGSAEAAVSFSIALHRHTESWNRGRIEGTKRWFRMGVATGQLAHRPNLKEGFDYAGTTIADAIYIQAASKHGELVMDPATYESLPPDIRNHCGPEETIRGKRDETLRIRRLKLADTLVLAFPDSENTPFRSSADLRREAVQLLGTLDQIELEKLAFLIEMPQERLLKIHSLRNQTLDLLSWADSPLGPGIERLVDELRYLHQRKNSTASNNDVPKM